MASATSYQNFSPRALEPYPIESKLAELAYSGYGNSPAQAQTALDQYWYERQLNEGIYGQEVAAQHEEARKNIAAQIQEARWKAMGEAKDPTVLQLMANSPDSPLNDVDRNALSDLVLRARHGQDVTDLQHAGTAANQLSQGGYDPTGAMANVGITNLGPYKGPALVQAAQIRLQGDLAKAAASRAGAANAGPTVHQSYAPDPDHPGVTTTTSWGAKTGQTPEGATDYAVKHGLVTPPLSTPPAGASAGASQPRAETDKGTARPLTNVPPVSTKPAPASAAPADAQRITAVRSWVETNKGVLGPQAYADIQAGMKMNGGNPQLKLDPKSGKVKLFGASGQSYP
jgi:hypothetical protein